MAPRLTSGGQGSFLVSADLGENPDERLGRRKRARLHQEEKAAEELTAEKRPRTQDAWLENERKQSKLPKVKGADEDKDRAAPDQEDGIIGKKKNKRIAALNAKKAQKEQRKAAKEAHVAATASSKKPKAGAVSNAAAEVMNRSRGDPAREQRLLAIVAEKIACSPEKELELFDVFFELHEKGSDQRTRHMALLSATAVFKDLVPGYRIRELTEKEKQVKRSREVIAQENHELGLLKAYRRLLPVLEAAMRRDPLVFAPALAALTVAASEFNYRQRLIGTAVKHATSQLDAVREVVADALREMVQADQRLECSREVVLAIGRLAQSTASARHKGGSSAKSHDEAIGGGDPNVKAQGLKSELFKVLLHVPLGKVAAAADQDISRQLVDADDETRRGLDEAQVHVSAEKAEKAESELLMEIFVVYLRILKQRHLHGKDLLPAVLTGLARWGQQVNLELLLEVLTELRCVVEESLSQSNEFVSLQGLHCTLVLLSGPSQALTTDMSWLPDSLRSALMLSLSSLHSTHSESVQWPPPRCFFMEGEHVRASAKDIAACLETDSVPSLVFKCLEAALKCPQAFGRASDSALAQLIENLFVLAAASDPRVGFPLLREAALLLRRHSRLHTILDNEGGLFGLGGVTERAVTVTWHLQALGFSVVPELAKAGKALASTIVNRRVNVGDIFPMKDSRSWLSAEVISHIAALSDKSVPAPARPENNWGRETKAQMRAKVAAAFLSEAELEAACACKGSAM